MANDIEGAARAALAALKKELDAALLRAETAEAYLQQAEELIQELEKALHEQKGWGLDLAAAAEKLKRDAGQARDKDKDEEVRAFLEEWFDYDPMESRYKRRPLRTKAPAARKAAEDRFQREFQALKDQVPPDVRKEAEKTRDATLASGALGKRHESVEERKRGGLPGLRYRLELRADQPGMVRAIVSSVPEISPAAAPSRDDAAYYTEVFSDRLTETDMMEHAERFAGQALRALKMVHGHGSEAAIQLAADISTAYRAMINNGEVRRVLER